MTAQTTQSRTRHLVTFLIIFAFAGLIMSRARGCRPPAQQGVRPQDTRVVEVKIQRWYIEAEVADTPELRGKGLASRSGLEPGHGMLFVYPEACQPDFWMKDTTIPLSIAFIREDGTIVQIEKMQPADIRLVSPSEPIKYALEVRQGWFEDRGLKPGVRAELPAEIPHQPAS